MAIFELKGQPPASIDPTPALTRGPAGGGAVALNSLLGTLYLIADLLEAALVLCL